MNQLPLSFTLDSTTMLILIVVVILVFALHFYLRRLIGKPSLAEAAPSNPISAARSAKPVADELRANVKP